MVNVTYMASGNLTTNASLAVGTVWTLNLTKEVEESQFLYSNKTFRITSDKNITVVSVSGWEGRFQSHVVQPEQNLGSVYHVPSLNYTKIAASFNLTMTSYVRFLPFRLMIINAVSEENSVTIKWVNESGESQKYVIMLHPYNLYQIQINETVREIDADHKMAVILTHPCFDSQNCSCNMILNQLQPFVLNEGIDRFPMPPFFIPKQLLVTTNKPFKVCQGYFTTCNDVWVQNSSDILPLLPNFTNGASLISTSMHVSLQLVRPGLILDLIPVSMFSGCYLVDFNSSRSGVLVIANTSSTNDVRMNNWPLPPYIWNVMNGTEYSWAVVVGQRISTIWHPFARIGVYMFEGLESNNTYGSAATVINRDPDRYGCLVSPEMFVLGKKEMNWSMSREYCMKNADLFARLNNISNQDKMVSDMTDEDTTEGWISLRRSLYTTDWYWKNEDSFSPNVNFTNWDNGQPERPEKGLCASVSLDPKKNFKWKSASCCSNKKPICYIGPKHLTLSDTL
ncbi:uncharacterized protein LOC132103697 [Carassius carassius]|uniref:uncharacterized protein LOC132103697 n=1 Tax=Carassius carassius TaxID=217509 RepID=UPI002868A3AC|nr:uncharacterized protein LOC132103697 [Carassius carassius]